MLLKAFVTDSIIVIVYPAKLHMNVAIFVPLTFKRLVIA